MFLTDPNLQGACRAPAPGNQQNIRETTARKGGSLNKSLKPLHHFQGFMKIRNNKKIRKYNKKHTSWGTEKSAQRRQKMFYWFLGSQTAWRLVEARLAVRLTLGKL